MVDAPHCSLLTWSIVGWFAYLVVHVCGDDPLAVLVPRDPAAGLGGRAPQRHWLVPHHSRVLGVLSDLWWQP